MNNLLFIFVVLATLVSTSLALLFPGIQPAGYAPGQVLGIRVGSLTSTRGVLPYPFYSVKTCKPSPSRFKAERKKENIGELMLGYQDEPSEYFVETLRNFTCRKVCDTVSYESAEMKNLVKRIDEYYRGNMALDGLPVAQETKGGPRAPKVILGYPLGVPSKMSPTKKALINNHLHFNIYFNEPDVHNDNNEETFRIVGFHVSAYSINYEDVNSECDMGKSFNPSKFGFLSSEGANEVSYTYSVSWIPEPDILWATRWDIYLKGSEVDRRIHWLSLVNACTIALCLAALIAMIMIRALRRDLARYNEAITAEEAQEETGWKLVHGDVFRAPQQPVTLSILVASGVQLLIMSAATLAISMSGFLNPQNRGGLVSALILSFVCASFFSGFVGAVLLKYFKRQAWKNAFAIAFFLPGVALAMYIVMDCLHWAKHSSSAVPFLTIVALMSMWLLCTVPLTIVGAHFGYRLDSIAVPTRVNVIPRMVPASKHGVPSFAPVLIGALFPFGVAFVELLYILSSFWQGGVYYVFGFLTCVFVIVVLCTAESSIAVVYFHLCNEDHNWWWKSFSIGAAAGGYVFLYSLYFLFAVLPIRQPLSMFLYLGYMLMACSAISLLLGSVSFVAAFWFVRKIYGAVKID